MTTPKFYITTAINYPNGPPHVGHAYEALATDTIARFMRLDGRDVYFLTGADEHGAKMKQTAEREGLEPRALADRNTALFQEMVRALGCSNDDYIRTTEPRHRAAVEKILTAVHDNGRDDIYLGTYEGLYCVACEAYYTEDELNANGNCPIHDRPVELLKEENYFFRLSAYADRLLEHYDRYPDAVQPDIRRNEVLSLIKGGLLDFSISRTSSSWGVPLPWDPKHVCYVWFDALTNYITAAGYADDAVAFARWWPADVHMIGKDILRFHAVYWPAMLMAAGIEPPTKVFAHGFLLVGGEKMSKTKLTGIHPFELIEHFGLDAYRYHFLTDVQFGQDGSFSWESMLARYNADLANGLGNLASRVLAMIDSYFDGQVPDPGQAPQASEGLRREAGALVETYAQAMQDLRLTAAMASVTELVSQANQYLVEKAPWSLAKEPERRGDLAAVLYASAELLRIVAGLDDALHFVRRDVDLANPVGAAIGRRQRFRIHPGSGVRRSAQRHEQRLAIRADLDPARTLAERIRANDRLTLAVDDGEVAGRLVGHVHLDPRLGRRCGRGSGGHRRRFGRLAAAGGDCRKHERESDPAITRTHGRDDNAA
jgi:methionyl-tRNA synthetase